MNSNSVLSHTFGWLVGPSPGSGMSLQFIISGLLYLAVASVALYIPFVRNVETILPDHDQMKKAAPAT